MKRIVLLAFCVLLTGGILFAQNQDVEKDKDLIKDVIQNAYVDGLCNNADTEAVMQGFHPGFTLFGIGEGNTMWEVPIYNWIEYAKNGKKKGFKYSFQNELTTIHIQFIDVVGTAAVAKIDFIEGKIVTTVDYISLLKFKDGWKIVSKIFYSYPKKNTDKSN